MFILLLSLFFLLIMGFAFFIFKTKINFKVKVCIVILIIALCGLLGLFSYITYTSSNRVDENLPTTNEVNNTNGNMFTNSGFNTIPNAVPTNSENFSKLSNVAIADFSLFSSAGVDDSSGQYCSFFLKDDDTYSCFVVEEKVTIAGSQNKVTDILEIKNKEELISLINSFEKNFYLKSSKKQLEGNQELRFTYHWAKVDKENFINCLFPASLSEVEKEKHKAMASIVYTDTTKENSISCQRYYFSKKQDDSYSCSITKEIMNETNSMSETIVDQKIITTKEELLSLIQSIKANLDDSLSTYDGVLDFYLHSEKLEEEAFIYQLFQNK